MTTTNTTPVHVADELDERIDRLRTWVAHVPAQHRAHVAARVDQLFVLLGELVAEDPEPAA